MVIITINKNNIYCYFIHIHSHLLCVSVVAQAARSKCHKLDGF